MSLTEYVLTISSKPKTYLVPERERTDPPPISVGGMIKVLMKFSDREVIDKCGLDAYFFLRYLKTLLVIFVPIAACVIPILIPINYVGGKGQSLEATAATANDSQDQSNTVVGLDTLAWGNVRPENVGRRWAHLLLALMVVGWVCTVVFFEMRVYVKVRQDYLTSAEHRLRASATTVLVNNIPEKWLSKEALGGLFDVFPGGIKNIWLTRDLTELLEKIHRRDKLHTMLEKAQTDLIRECKRKQIKKHKHDEKQRRKSMHLKAETREEKQKRMRQLDEAAKKRAEGEGTTSGEHREVPRTVSEQIGEARRQESYRSEQRDEAEGGALEGLSKIPVLGQGISKIGEGLMAGVGKAGQGLMGLGVQNHDENQQNTILGGFILSGPDAKSEASTAPPSRGSERRRVHMAPDAEGSRDRLSATSDTPIQDGRLSFASDEPKKDGRLSFASDTPKKDGPARSRPVSGLSLASNGDRVGPGPTAGNTVRRLTNKEDMYVKEQTRFWQFWKPPSGGYASPVPQTEGGEYFKNTDASLPMWTKIKRALPFAAAQELDPIEYPEYHNAEYTEDQARPAEWEKWIKKSARPTHRLPLWDIMAVPFVTKKVDTIFYCREELARLNMEIEEDQRQPERYPLMNSAFIQFHHQVAAHMACQGVIHHIPQQMAPRHIEISPRDVVWDNMAFSWWQEWIRTFIVTAIIIIMIIFWAIPIAWTGLLSQIDVLTTEVDFLKFINDSPSLRSAVQALAGVLPALFLAVLLLIVPFILEFLAGVKGAKTGAQKNEFVQLFFFIFLFFQVFLVVSISSFFAASVDDLFAGLEKFLSPLDTLTILANDLPAAANYFFSYMILQALSTSSGTLLQIGALIMWYLIARFLDSTARSKWRRQTTLRQIRWGAFFPIYTNFACIGLVYSVIAPLIAVFTIVTF